MKLADAGVKVTFMLQCKLEYTVAQKAQDIIAGVTGVVIRQHSKKNWFSET
jgi:hypothetical protein